jgi:hypothetical protein
VNEFAGGLPGRNQIEDASGTQRSAVQVQNPPCEGVVAPKVQEKPAVDAHATYGGLDRGKVKHALHLNHSGNDVLLDINVWARCPHLA